MASGPHTAELGGNKIRKLEKFMDLFGINYTAVTRPCTTIGLQN